MIRIGLVQMICEKGAVASNLARTLHYLDEASALDIDILAFPEASLSGYGDPAQHPGAVLRLGGPEVAQLLAMTRGNPATLLVGLIEHNPSGKPYITHVIMHDGQILGTYRKMTSGQDQEHPDDWYAVGDTVPVFAHDSLTFGIAICADISDEGIFAACARQGARIVFEVAAPGLYGEQATRNWRSGYEWWEGECRSHLTRHTRANGIWVAVATQAGRTVDEDFPGGGYVYAPDGRRLFATLDWSPGAAYLALDLDAREVRPL
jgi:predicted amidohydrolase